MNQLVMREAMRMQLSRLHNAGLFEHLDRAAREQSVPLCYVIAVASRESGCVNQLGDRQKDGNHGVGLMQIDIQHPVALAARDDESWWKDPYPLIAFGVKELADNIMRIRKTFPNFTRDRQLRIAASGYNCDLARAIHDEAIHGNSDLHTTGANYGADVMARAGIFGELIGEGLE